LGGLAKLMSEDIEAGTLRLRLQRALRELSAETHHRHRELHVSDFTGAEDHFCLRSLLHRYFRGEKREGGMTWIEYDGKWREEKWLKLFQQAGILKDYQLSLKLGPLSGHPDFIIDMGHGPCVVELTGFDSKVPPIQRGIRLAVKRRQCLFYMVMYQKLVGPIHCGFVLAENKGSCDFKIEKIPHDGQKAVKLFDRPLTSMRWIEKIEQAKTSEERVRLYRQTPKCGRKGCPRCAQ